MCNFFACIVTKTGGVLFTESESHEEVISRSGLADDSKHFVRVEYTAEVGYGIDERAIPEWYERIAAKGEQAVKATYDAARPAWGECCNNIGLLQEVYEDIHLPQVKGFWSASEQRAYKEYRDISVVKWKEYKAASNAELIKYKGKISTMPGYLA